MEHDCCWLLGQLFEDFCNILGGDGRELLHAAVDQEALESAYALTDERLQLGDVAWHDSAIEANVDPALSLRSG